jgi:hypothetical protein
LTAPSRCVSSNGSHRPPGRRGCRRSAWRRGCEPTGTAAESLPLCSTRDWLPPQRASAARRAMPGGRSLWPTWPS